MTNLTKRFIELADIIGVRLECRKCGCALLLDLGREAATVENLLGAANKILCSCPACGTPWTTLPDGRLAFDSELKDFFRRMCQIREIESKFGCTISLEIKDDKQPRIP
jgi:hypothetical protein